jgi:hypothetical protein
MEMDKLTNLEVKLKFARKVIVDYAQVSYGHIISRYGVVESLLSYHIRYISLKLDTLRVIKVYDFGHDNVNKKDIFRELIDNQVKCLNAVEKCGKNISHKLIDHGLEGTIEWLVFDYIEGVHPGPGDSRIIPLIREIRSIKSSSLTLAHNDLHTSNIIVNDHGAFLIDWELGGFKEPTYEADEYRRRGYIDAIKWFKSID